MSHKVTLQSLRAARNAAAGITVVATNTATKPNFSTGEFFSLNSLSDMANNVEIDFLIPGFLSLSLRGKAVEAQRGNQVSSILVLMDTGANCDRDIVGAHVMRSFADSLGDICSPCLNKNFCSPLTGSSCSQCLGTCSIQLHLITDHNPNSSLLLLYVCVCRFTLLK